MALFGQTAPALRAIDLIVAPFILASIYWLGTRVYSRRAGLWAALLFGVFYFTETFWTLTQNDGIVLLPMTLAMVCVFKAAESGRRTWLWALIAGLLCGWTFWFKYPFVLFIGAAGLSYALLRSNAAPRIRRSDTAAFTIGLLSVILGGIGVLMALGAWDALVESARVTSQYTALSLNWADFSDAIRVTVGFRGSHWGLLFVLAAAGIMVALTPVPSPSGRGERKAVPNLSESGKVLLLWLDAGLLIMLAQAKVYDYHWLPMLPPLTLFGAIGIERVLKIVFEPQTTLPTAAQSDEHKENEEHIVGAVPALPPRNFEAAMAVGATASLRLAYGSPLRPTLPIRGLLSILIAVALLAILANGIWSRALPYLTGQEDQITYYHHFQGGEFMADESQLVADFLRARVMPGDSLYIWGFRPEVYYLTRLNPPTRFIFQFPLVADWYPEEWKEENVEILWAALPPFVLVLQVDYMPWVTGSHEDSNTLLQDYDDLNDWLIYNYERETMIGNFIVWQRKS
jgi:4-amino-4-deoxy-L-arabinose transferase-like glycosyltransferase